MLVLILRRAGFSLFSLLVVSLILFALTRSIPDSPARIVLGDEATEEQIAQFEADHGLDRPVLVQYLAWLERLVLHGDLGRSFTTRLDMNAQVTETLPVTLELVCIGFVVALTISLVLGTLSALWRDSPVDYAARLLAVLGVSIPGFWPALVLVLALTVERDWFPPGGFVPLGEGLAEHLRSIALPCLCLSVFYMAVLTRMTRSSLLEVLGQDYMRTARAAGLSRPRVLLYGLRNALVPVVTIAGVSFGHMFGLALIIERVFNIGGMSRALLTAIQQRDYALVQAVVMMFTIIFVVANLIADLLNAWLNPRLAARAA
ncbi:ABC transporter permease [Siccirubricoccus sp. KC 17139]|uniref:ABC transporter permease n=1 Tax=Siccirubricoccus soli TaxID=2899147 RepID=A0ABT1D5R4_9PROT|nr:ABC transporter permease [Siccirubricoccus soli]MCO6417268.1 ABC transporter permease [Siccirubricoccus soli]MCP2683403.1 ABC transporter permease [Siccirubricoccus soli]